ncbi:MAG TPA: signal peptide peptidase SppA, partial [Chitinophagaceae bacterium]
MKSFFKVFLATLSALLVFSLIVFFLFVGWVAGITSKGRPRVLSKSVLVLDLSQWFHEQAVQRAVSLVSNDDEADVPGLYDVIRLLHTAASDPDISGLYIVA